MEISSSVKGFVTTHRKKTKSTLIPVLLSYYLTLLSTVCNRKLDVEFDFITFCSLTFNVTLLHRIEAIFDLELNE